MKKLLTMIMVFVLCCSLCACNTNTQNNDGTEENELLNSDSQGNGNNSDTDKNQQIEGMEILCDSESLANCYTNDGYYYLTEEAAELKNGEYGTYLMYMDFATQQEIFLCSNTGCKHNTSDCPAVFLMDDFPTMSCGIFVYQDKLFVLSKEIDYEGVASQVLSSSIGSEMIETEASQATLYQMNLDGTNRHKVYTFDAGLTVEDIVLGNDDGLYFVTKKTSNTQGKDNNSITNSSEKKLVFWDMKSKSVEDVCSLSFDDGMIWKITGCYNNVLVLNGVDYGKDLSADDYASDGDAWDDLYKNSSEVIAILDLSTNILSEKYRIDNSKEHSIAVMDNMLYVSYADTKEIKSVNLENNEEKTLCSLQQSSIMDTFDNTLCCRSWDLASDYTYYFVNTETGEIQHSSLVNESLGWALEYKAEIGSQVLAVYDYEATSLGDGAYDITQYKYALIEKSDLYAGNANYNRIKMIGKGC
jgi:hypothetical protein